MKIIVFFLSLFCVTSLTAQQNFQKSYGTVYAEHALDLVETSQKDIIVLGTISQNVNLTKMDSSGNLIWSKQLPITQEYSAKMRGTTDGGFIFCGTGQITNTTANQYILKLDAGGEQEWCVTSQSWSPLVRDVIQTLDGGYLAVADGLILKFNALGNLQWKKLHTSTTTDNLKFRTIQQVTSDSSFIVSGYMINSSNTISTASVSKISKTGESDWHKLISGINELRNVQVIENDHVILFCRNSIIELNENGEYISKILLNQSEIVSGEKREDHFLIYGIGGGQSGIGEHDFSISKLDLTGTVLWSKFLGGILSDYIVSQRSSMDGGSIILGNTRSFSIGEDDYFLIKTDSLNTFNCNTIPHSMTTTVGSGSTIDFTTTVDANPFHLIGNITIPGNQSITLEEHDACDCIEPTAQFEFYPKSGSIINNSIWPGQSTFYIYDSNAVLVNEFTYEGTYTICLTVENACGSDSICELVEYTPMPVSTDELEPDEKSVVIIPINDHQLLIRFESEQYNTRIRLIDLTGKAVIDEQFSGSERVVEVGNLQRAMYFMQIEDQKDALRFSRKMVIGHF